MKFFPLVVLLSCCSLNLSAQEVASSPKVENTQKNWQEIIKKAPDAKYVKAAEFLVKYMPARDLNSLSEELFWSNIKFAYEARQRFAWCKDLPEDVFFNDVLPYVVVSEARDPWREQFLKIFGDMVKDCKTSTEAALKISASIQDALGVKYNVKRRCPDQSPKESMELKMASCTGLSILLIDALRSVGIPSRMAGVLTWAHVPGNHNWVECFVDGEWKMLEYNQKEFNTPWVIEACGLLDMREPEQAVWATSWQKNPAAQEVKGPKAKWTFFPMIWTVTGQGIDEKDTYVNSLDVSDRYAELAKKAMKIDSEKFQLVFVEVTDGEGKKVARKVYIHDRDGKILDQGISKAEGADMREMLTLKLPRDGKYTIMVEKDNGIQHRRPISATNNASQVFHIQQKDGCGR